MVYLMVYFPTPKIGRCVDLSTTKFLRFFKATAQDGSDLLGPKVARRFWPIKFGLKVKIRCPFCWLFFYHLWLFFGCFWPFWAMFWLFCQDFVEGLQQMGTYDCSGDVEVEFVITGVSQKRIVFFPKEQVPLLHAGRLYQIFEAQKMAIDLFGSMPWLQVQKLPGHR